MKYAKWGNIWINDYIAPNVKYKTLERYKSILERLYAEIGGIELDDISPIMIQQYISKLMISGNLINGSGLNTSTINMIISIFLQSMKVAKLLGVASMNYDGKIKRPRLVEKEIECFSIEEQRKIEDYILKSKKLKLLGILICLYTGLRIGELLALRWEDVDFKNKTIVVNHSCYDGKDCNKEVIRVLVIPKTKTSKRIIPLPKKIISILVILKRNSKTKYVISDDENIFSIRSYQRTFELLLKKLNIKHRGFHALRHTFATRALECGMDVKTLSELLGHKNSMITLNRYAHSLMEHKIKMMNKLGSFLSI